MSYILQSVKRIRLIAVKATALMCLHMITVRCHGPFYLTISYLFAAAFVVLLLHLPILVEGAKRACPEISNITTIVLPFSSPFVTPEPQEAAPLILSVLFATTHRSACQCNLHEVIRGRPRLKARVNRCE